MNRLLISALVLSLMGGAALAGQPTDKGNGKDTASEASTGAGGKGTLGHAGEAGESGQSFGEAASGLGKSGQMGDHATQ